MSRIFLIRHAETDLRGTFCGHSDPPLNKNGHQQLQILIATLRARDIAAVYSSDLKRARTTAQTIADQLITPLSLRSELREIHFGQWESLTWAQVEQRDPTYAQRWIDAYPNVAAPDGEPYEAFRTRVLNAFGEIEAMPSEGNTAIVTHAGVMQLLLTELCGHTSQQAYDRTRDYCCVVPFQPIHAVQHV